MRRAIWPACAGACLLAVLLASCNDRQEKNALFRLMEHTGIVFENNVTDDKLENSFLFRNFYNGGGVAIADINNDSLPDVFLTSNMANNKLFLNKGNWKFEDITAKAGIVQNGQWSTGVVFADINNDGWLDVYVCSSGHMKSGNRKNQLFINNHDLTFTESAAKYGLDISAYTTQVSFFDYDMDGDLDCFMINNSPIPVNQLGYANRRDLPDKDWPVAPFLKGGGDHLFRNDNGHFTEVTKEAGIHGSLISFGLGVSVGDINDDGYPDVYVSNDSYERDYLYINQKNGTFRDDFEGCFAHASFSSMGADIADINNDGYPDIFTTDMLPDDHYRLKTTGAFDNIDLYRSKLQAGFYHQYVKNCLQVNDRNGKFIDVANYSGVAATDWSWGALMFDADNDGLSDIYVCNGVNRDVTNLDFMDFFANDIIQKMVMTGKKEEVDQVVKKIPRTPLLNKAYRNMGNLQFSDACNSWGLTQASFSNGAAYGDLDNDGDLDLIVSNENQPAFIYRNNARELNKNNYISVVLKGNNTNTFAIGSKIKVYKGDHVFYRELVPSRGFQSSVDYKQVIGLGHIAAPDSMIITWPDRTVTKYNRPAINKTYIIQQTDQHKQVPDAPVIAVDSLFRTVKNDFQKHQEDDYVDFYYERNIPRMVSREGPKAATGDVNGDGLIDVYIGGTPQHPGQLYLQTAEGKFEKKKEPVFEQFIEFEDGAVLLFDADKDGDLDLFVGPAGNNAPPYSRQMQNRLFKNDGKGNFILDASAFPANGMNIAVAVANDFDKDGDPDLFVGGRSVPRDYGTTPTSFIYINDGNGHFTDMAKNKNPDIANIGMVTGAVWADVEGDANKELIITGEWMAPRIFSFAGDHFKEIRTNLAEMYGWWQTVTATDINGDGKTDLVLGNIGENFYFRPDQKDPVKMWINDFDQNGLTEKVLTYTIQGRDMPVFLKHEMQDQLPSIKKQSLTHEQFAKKSIQDLFPGDIMKKSIVKQFNYPSSCIAINNGNGNFTVQKLPFMVQLSCVNVAHAMDIDQDGDMDLVLGGNEFGFLPQFERLDASFGDVLVNNGKGGFAWMGPDRSGLSMRGEVRDIVEIPGRKGNYLLFLQNDDYPALYKIQHRLKTPVNH